MCHLYWNDCLRKSPCIKQYKLTKKILYDEPTLVKMPLHTSCFSQELENDRGRHFWAAGSSVEWGKDLTDNVARYLCECLRNTGRSQQERHIHSAPSDNQEEVLLSTWSRTTSLSILFSAPPAAFVFGHCPLVTYFPVYLLTCCVYLLDRTCLLTVLYHTVLPWTTYCSVLTYSTVLRCIYLLYLLHCTYCTVLYCIIQFCAICTVLYSTVLTSLLSQFTLMAAFPDKILGILLFCACVMVIGVIQVRRSVGQRWTDNKNAK